MGWLAQTGQPSGTMCFTFLLGSWAGSSKYTAALCAILMRRPTEGANSDAGIDVDTASGVHVTAGAGSGGGVATAGAAGHGGGVMGGAVMGGTAVNGTAACGFGVVEVVHGVVVRVVVCVVVCVVV